MSDERVEVIFGKGTAEEFRPHWTSILVRKSLDELCHYIEIETSIKDRPKINKHARFGVYYSRGGREEDLVPLRPVATGFVDNLILDSSVKKNSMVFNGRSAARDIIDSRWSASIRNQTLFGVVKVLAKQFGTTCDILGAHGDPTGLIEEFAFENESPWKLIQEEAANQGYLVTSSQTGGLYVWRVASGLNQWGFSLKEGQNIVSFRDQDAGSRQFHRYVFKGGMGESFEGFDWTCPNRKRVLTVNLTDPSLTKAKLKRRVETEIRRRQERHITATVSAWGLPPELIAINKKRTRQHEVFWETNFLTPVQIPTLEIDATLLTSQIEYRADNKTMSCDIQLSNPEEFQ